MWPVSTMCPHTSVLNLLACIKFPLLVRQWESWAPQHHPLGSGGPGAAGRQAAAGHGLTALTCTERNGGQTAGQHSAPLGV